MNTLWVPVEVRPPRERSASLNDLASEAIKTMNPADKFLSPRPSPSKPEMYPLKSSPSTMSTAPARESPLRPLMRRLKTSPSSPMEPASSRSASPASDKPQRGRRRFFGLRGPGSPKLERSRSAASSPRASQISLPVPVVEETSYMHERDVSPHSPVHAPLSELRDIMVIPDIPEEMEENEDDDNFAVQHKLAQLDLDRAPTPLSPPPAHARAASRPREGPSKPLPALPITIVTKADSLRAPCIASPRPLRINPFSFDASEAPGSRFSVSTAGTLSPTDSTFGYSGSSCDEDESADERGAAGNFTYNPTISACERSGFDGYALPAAEHSSKTTLKRANAHTTFGAGAAQVAKRDLETLLNEMGYLGTVIVGKEALRA